MARFYKFSLFYLFTLLLLSCQEGREAGDLLGQWRLEGADTYYLSFSGSVTLFRDTKSTDNMVYGNFQHKGDSLFIQCYSEKEEAKDTAVVENYFGFKPFNNIRVKVAALDKDQLVLTKDSQTWTFEKY